MGEHWRTRGHGVGWFVWRKVYRHSPRLCWLLLWPVHRFWLAYWIKGADGTWRRVA